MPPLPLLLLLLLTNSVGILPRVFDIQFYQQVPKALDLLGLNQNVTCLPLVHQ
jgi:hypothetical protein